MDRPFEKDMQVNGATILSIIKGLGAFTRSAYDILEEAGLTDIRDDLDSWYSMEKWLNAFKKITEKTGEKSLFSIGLKIPVSARFPAGIKTVEEGLAAIDIAYHMNHRNARGEVLYNRDTGQMLEGIGHYLFEKDINNNGIMKCNNPYPDEFDRGIIYAVTRKYAQNMARVEVDTMRPTRSQGAESTFFLIEWR